MINISYIIHFCLWRTQTVKIRRKQTNKNDSCFDERFLCRFQAKTVEEKKLWAHHIKRIILENHHAIIPQKVRNHPHQYHQYAHQYHQYTHTSITSIHTSIASSMTVSKVLMFVVLFVCFRLKMPSWK